MKRIKEKPERSELTTLEISKELHTQLAIAYLQHYADKISRFEFYSMVLQSGINTIQKPCQKSGKAKK